MPQVIVNITADGQTTVEAQGVTGSGCRELTRAIEEAIGHTTGDVTKSEYFRTATQEQKEGAAMSQSFQVVVTPSGQVRFVYDDAIADLQRLGWSSVRPKLVTLSRTAGSDGLRTLRQSVGRRSGHSLYGKRSRPNAVGSKIGWPG